MIPIQELLDSIIKLLPVQAPLPSFIHNNILQPFENLEFDDAINKAQSIYHSHCYMFENYYLQAIKSGRIQDKDIEHVLFEQFKKEDLKESSPFPSLNKLEFYRQLLKEPPEFVPENNLRWRLSHSYLIDQSRPAHHLFPRISHLTYLALNETPLKTRNLLWNKLANSASIDPGTKIFLEHLLDEKFYEDQVKNHLNTFCLKILWATCVEKVDAFKLELQSPEKGMRSLRYRRFFQTYFNDSMDVIIHPPIVRLLSSYFDQGLAAWKNPDPGSSLWQHFENYFNSPFSILPSWVKQTKQFLMEYKNLKFSFDEIIFKEMSLTGFDEKTQIEYIKELALDLRGWTGLINKLENEPSLAPIKVKPCKLKEFLAMRLIIERAVVRTLSKNHGVHELPKLQQSPDHKMSPLELSYIIFHVSFAQGFTALDMDQLTPNQFNLLIKDLAIFHKNYRKKILHQAYEYDFYSDALDALWVNSHRIQSIQEKPRAQVLFCIDDREESFRRHLESIDPKIITFGVVGFFGIDMNFVKPFHPKAISYCPVILKPRRTIFEQPFDENQVQFNSLKKQNDLIQIILLKIYFGSRSIFRGSIASLSLGLMSPFYLFLRTFFPSLFALIKSKVKNSLSSKIPTKLTIHQYHDTPIGYSFEEMSDIVVNILHSTGLTKDFSPLIVLLGHGSTSVNNPHINAYGCGACGGRPGAPNARIFAQMANTKEVRNLLKSKHHIVVPDETYFIGAFHNTCNDQVEYFDPHLIPESHQHQVEIVQSSMLKASKVNSFERSKRFANHPQHLNYDVAYEHVHKRSLDLSEPRPEYGHLRVAMCVVGRRMLSKGLNLDRRSFLVSYDPMIDHDGSILKNVLLNSLPVTAGINLDYFFSFMDSEKFGCGSKLPLNIIGLLGVITGSTGDLRLGLPRQSVDLHEPIRLLVVVETTMEPLLKIIKGNQRAKFLVENKWIQLAIVHPETSEMHLYSKNGFEPFIPESRHLKYTGFGSSVSHGETFV
jgi:uncharacterized protein YbcC (UPF0753/DUF2309 family)